tara:strand:+ start:1533 stop:1679 length:147 start_codon:yes stop_codon:yes gene_type:complete
MANTSVMIAFKIPKKMHDDLKKFAEMEDRSIAGQVRFFVKKNLTQRKK